MLISSCYRAEEDISVTKNDSIACTDILNLVFLIHLNVKAVTYRRCEPEFHLFLDR